MPNRLALSPQSKKYKAIQFLASVEGALRRKGQPTADALKSIRSFLFLQMDVPLGSLVHATPLYEAIKLAMPDAQIAVAASSMAAGVLRDNPYIDQCMVVPDPGENFLEAVAAARRLYRSLPQGPVCIVTTTGNQRPVLAMVAMLAGDATRVGYTLALPLYTVALDFVADRPQIENNLDILRALGHASAAPEPRVFFRQEDEDAAAKLLEKTGNAAEIPRIAWVTQCSRTQPKQWGQQRFREVIRGIIKEAEVLSVFLGTKNEAKKIDELREKLDLPGISLAGRTTISQLAAVLAQCDWIVGLDTGTLHVARAVGLPGVVLAPAWQNPMEWLPVGDPRYSILCGPMMPMPKAEYQMEEISVEQVLQETRAMMDRFPASLAARAARLDRARVLQPSAQDRRMKNAAHRSA